MTGVMMKADSEWLRYHQVHSIGKPVVFYGSPKRKTNNYDFLFCVQGRPLSIWAVGRIANQVELDQNAAWPRYASALGAPTEIDWKVQATKVFENSDLSYNGLILAIELSDFAFFSRPIQLGEVEIEDTHFQLMKEVSEKATAELLARLPKATPSEKQSNPIPTSIAIDIQVPSEEPGRETIILNRIIRDTKLSLEVKNIYKHRCQLCSHRLEFDNGQGYAEAHHIRPLGSPHNGPDSRDNILCVCPNCHAKLDFGGMLLDPRKINTDINAHDIRQEYIEYHNMQIYNKP
jgi:HNH endonuclease